MFKSRAPFFSSFALHRALRGACVVFIALVFSHYFSRTQTFWLTAIAFFLTQAEVGFPLHQGLQRFFWIVILFFVGGQASLWLHSVWELPAVILGLATLTAYSYAYHSRRFLGLHFSLLVLTLLLLTLLLPAPFLSPAYLLDILMGAALGLSSTVLLFPDQPDREFSKRVTPLVHDLSAYLGALADFLLRPPGSESESEVERKRGQVEKRWANKDETFPVWVFEAGFNPALKPGQYYFVVHLGQVTEILFALHHFARHAFPPDLIGEFTPIIRDSAERSQELLSNIALLLEGKKLPLSQTDFVSDLPALEECFQSKIKLSLELLDLSRDYVYLAAFIRYLKDLRLQLLQLAATLT